MVSMLDHGSMGPGLSHGGVILFGRSICSLHQGRV